MKPLSKSVEVGREESYFRFALSGKGHFNIKTFAGGISSFPKALAKVFPYIVKH